MIIARRKRINKNKPRRKPRKYTSAQQALIDFVLRNYVKNRRKRKPKTKKENKNQIYSRIDASKNAEALKGSASGYTSANPLTIGIKTKPESTKPQIDRYFIGPNLQPPTAPAIEALPKPSQKLLEDIDRSKGFALVSKANQSVIADFDDADLSRITNEMKNNQGNKAKIEALADEIENNIKQKDELAGAVKKNRMEKFYDNYRGKEFKPTFYRARDSGLIMLDSYSGLVKSDMVNALFGIPEVRYMLESFDGEVPDSASIDSLVSKGLNEAEQGRNTNINEQYESLGTGDGRLDLKKVPPSELIPLSNLDIDKMMANNPHYIGTYSIDTLKRIPAETINKIKQDLTNPNGNFSFIINTIPISDQVGHWVSVLVTRNPPTVEFYNPSGRPPERLMEREIKSLLKRVDQPKSQFKVNQIQDQDARTANCGWFAMKFLKDRYAGHPFKTSSGFNAVIGEKNIRAFKRFYKKFGFI